MSPTMQDSKFEVIMSSESDLEEGEIPEFDFLTAKPSVENGGIGDEYSRSSERSRLKFKMKHEKEYLDDNYIRQEKLLERKFRDYKKSCKSNKSSSDEEMPDLRDSKKLSLTVVNNSVNRKSKPRHVKGSYGTVEDIMTQIDATLCRKSLCNYKKRKSREISIQRYSPGKTRRTRSSSKEKSRSRHRPRKSSSSESDSDDLFNKNKKITRNKIPVCKRKREKELKRIREVVYIYSDDSLSDEDSSPRKKIGTVKKRDFDEYRKELLEKLSKEKSDKSNCENIPLPDELTTSSDIQEIEMTDDTNTFVDKVNESKPPEGKSFMDSFYVTRNVPQSQTQESDNEDDDTELIKLRLLALTSNRKKKEAVSDDASSHSLDLEQSVDVKSEENLSSKDDNDSDLDRNEFLLRAEALKTALVKKHKLKKIKGENKLTEITEEKLKVNEEINIQVNIEVPEVKEDEGEKIVTENSSPGEIVDPLELARRKLLKVRNVLMKSEVLNNSVVKEDSLQARLLALANETSLPKPLMEEPVTKPENFTPLDRIEVENEAVLNKITNRKRRKRLRWKIRQRNKKRLEMMADALKENAVAKENADSTKVEEDDEKLRVQLLNDLSRKKDLKLVENKNVEIVENKPLVDKQISSVKSKTSKVAPLGKVPKAEIQRIIVHLGSDSSDDEDLEEDKPGSLNVPKSEEKKQEEVPNVPVAGNSNPLLADYERSVELLLQKARQEVEGRKEKNQKTVTATPEAVYKHLPPSQRLEYIRLKQKIAEKENLKKKTSAPDSNSSQTKSDPTVHKNPTNTNLNGIKRIVATSLRAAINNTQASSKSSSNNLQAPSILNNPIKCDLDSNQPLKSNSVNKPIIRSPIRTVNSQIPKVGSPVGNNRKILTSPVGNNKKILTSPLNGKKLLVSPEQRKIIAQNQANISRLKLLLKKIKIEKTVEERYDKEIQRMKNQLNLLELKRKQQRLKVENLAKQSKLIYATFQSNRSDIKKLNEAGKVEGSGNGKTEEKKDEQGNSNVEKEHVEIESKEISEKCENKTNTQVNLQSVCEVKTETKSEPESIKTTESETNLPPTVSSSKPPDLKEYNSPLQAFTAWTEDADSKRIDPNTIMCQYDLLGKCNDKECTFQHYRTS